MGLAIKLRERLGFADHVRIGSSLERAPVDGQIVLICRPCGRVLGREGDRIVECHPGLPLARARRDELRLGSYGVAIGLSEAQGHG